jgi:hypothetical protein
MMCYLMKLKFNKQYKVTFAATRGASAPNWQGSVGAACRKTAKKSSTPQQGPLGVAFAAVHMAFIHRLIPAVCR